MRAYQSVRRLRVSNAKGIIAGAEEAGGLPLRLLAYGVSSSHWGWPEVRRASLEDVYLDLVDEEPT